LVRAAKQKKSARGRAHSSSSDINVSCPIICADEERISRCIGFFLSTCESDDFHGNNQRGTYYATQHDEKETSTRNRCAGGGRRSRVGAGDARRRRRSGRRSWGRHGFGVGWRKRGGREPEKKQRRDARRGGRGRP